MEEMHSTTEEIHHPFEIRRVALLVEIASALADVEP